MSEDEKVAIESFQNRISDSKLDEDYFLKWFEVSDAEILLNLIEKQQKEIEELEAKVVGNICKVVEEEVLEKFRQENKELKEDLKNVLNQTLGAFEKNGCIDWNFTEIREKYNLGE